MDKNYKILYQKYKNKYLKLSKTIKNGGATVVGHIEQMTDKRYTIKRPYNGETILILGCGNSPLIFDKATVKKHLHKDMYTIDINEQMNPSCLTNMSHGTFCEIPDKSIEEIICEGFTMDILHSSNFIKEINRIKKPDGICTCDFKNVGTFRNYQGEWDNIYNNPPYIKFNQVSDFKIGNKQQFELTPGGYMKLYIKDSTGEYKDDFEVNNNGSIKIYIKDSTGEYKDNFEVYNNGSMKVYIKDSTGEYKDDFEVNNNGSMKVYIKDSTGEYNVIDYMILYG